MTKSPSPSVDEVAGLRDAVISAIERLYVPTSRPTYGDMIEAVTSAFDASLVSPPKAGTGEPVAWRVIMEDGYVLRLCENKAAAEDVKAEYPGSVTVEPLYANHEARGDGVRVTDEMVQSAHDAFVAASDWQDWDADEIKVQLRAALEAALPPLGDGRAEKVEP